MRRCLSPSCWDCGRRVRILNTPALRFGPVRCSGTDISQYARGQSSWLHPAQPWVCPWGHLSWSRALLFFFFCHSFY